MPVSYVFEQKNLQVHGRIRPIYLCHDTACDDSIDDRLYVLEGVISNQYSSFLSVADSGPTLHQYHFPQADCTILVIWNLTSAIEATTAENPSYIPTNPYIIIIIELEKRVGDLMISKPDFHAHQAEPSPGYTRSRRNPSTIRTTQVGPYPGLQD